jgi:hypothetical protein
VDPENYDHHEHHPKPARTFLLEEGDQLHIDIAQSLEEIGRNLGATLTLTINAGARKSDVLRLLRKILLHFEEINSKAEEEMDWYTLKWRFL